VEIDPGEKIPGLGNADLIWARDRGLAHVFPEFQRIYALLSNFCGKFDPRIAVRAFILKPPNPWTPIILEAS